MDKNPKIQGLVYDFLHFYSSANLIRHSYPLYRREVRLIRNKIGTKSWQDGKGFRSKDEKRLLCIPSGAQVYHYGSALKEELFKEKNIILKDLYPENSKAPLEKYEHLWGLKPFKDSHPASMKNWIEQNKNELDILKQPAKHQAQNMLFATADFIEGLTGIRPCEYKNFRLL